VYEPALHALFQDSIPERARAFTFSIVDVLCWSLPGMVSSVVGGYLYQKFGIVALRWALVATGAVYLISAVLRSGLEETLIRQEAQDKGPISLKETFSGVVESFKGIFEEISWLKGPLGRMMAPDIIHGVDWGLTGGFWLLFALDVIGVSRFEWGLLEASWNAIYLLLVPIAGLLSDRRGRIRVMRFSPGLFSILYLLLVMSRGFRMAFIIWIIWAIPDALWFASFEALWTDLVETGKRARISTLRSVLRMMAQMGSAALAGFLYEINPASPFCLAALAWFIAFLNLQILAKEKP
jgi:MFS family permease